MNYKDLTEEAEAAAVIPEEAKEPILNNCCFSFLICSEIKIGDTFICSSCGSKFIFEPSPIEDAAKGLVPFLAPTVIEYKEPAFFEPKNPCIPTYKVNKRVK
jgi:hypothetical protein